LTIIAIITERTINTSNIIFLFGVTGKNSTTKRNIKPAKPAKIPNAFHEPKILAVEPDRIPRERNFGTSKYKN
jgi:hypothetical protein